MFALAETETLEIGHSLAQENQPIKSPKIEESQLNEILPPSVSMQGNSSVSLPSNHNKRPQQVIGPHKGMKLVMYRFLYMHDLTTSCDNA